MGLAYMPTFIPETTPGKYASPMVLGPDSQTLPHPQSELSDPYPVL